MSTISRLQDNLERWLIHENYRFKELKEEENRVCVLIKDVGSNQMSVKIFEPLKQPGILVFGGKVIFSNRQTGRYLKLNDAEREKFHSSVKNYCDSIHTIHKIFKEDGKVVVGVYLVLDKVKVFTQDIVVKSIIKLTEMGDKTYRFIAKTF